MNLNALTVCQPYARLIEVGAKPVENRNTSFLKRMVGQDLAIHAGLSRDWFSDDAWALVGRACRALGLPAMRPSDFVFGKVVCVVRVAAVVDRDVALRGLTRRCAAAHQLEHVHGPHCAVLDQVRRLRAPVSARGQQGLWLLSREEEARVAEEVRAAAAPVAPIVAGPVSGAPTGTLWGVR